MNKLISPDANKQLYASMQGCMASIIFDDNFYTNVKKAASSVISRQMLEELKPDKDHFLVHLVALGDDETYGFNDNADGFSQATNQKYHKTFEKYAKLYREHNSSDPKFALGDVKLSFYNPDMRRVEIISWGNKKLASSEYETARAGKALSFSMGTSIPYDRDNISGKQCKTPATYEPWMKIMPGKFVDDWNGKTINKWAYVHNDIVKFFDISFVSNPADRTARYLQYCFDDDVMRKVASSNSSNVIPSASLAEANGLVAPSYLEDNILDCNYSFSNDMSKKSLLTKLASAEHQCFDIIYNNASSADSLSLFVKTAALNSFEKDFDITDAQKDAIFTLRTETMMHEFAKRASVLPFKSFVNTFFKNVNTEAVKYASCALLPTMFMDMLQRCEDNIPLKCGGDIETMFDAASELEAAYDLNNDNEVKKAMDEIADKLSLDEDKQKNRVMSITLVRISKSPTEDANTDEDLETSKAMLKSASADVKDAARFYTDVYTMYKLAALNNIAKYRHLTDKELILTTTQNFI